MTANSRALLRLYDRALLVTLLGAVASLLIKAVGL